MSNYLGLTLPGVWTAFHERTVISPQATNPAQGNFHPRAPCPLPTMLPAMMATLLATPAIRIVMPMSTTLRVPYVRVLLRRPWE